MKAVIFDMDGVIVDSEPIYLDLIRDIYADIGAEVPDEVHLSSCGADSEEWWGFIVDTYGVKGHTAKELAERERETIIAYMCDATTDKPFFDGVAEVLAELRNRGYKIALASASAYNVIDSVLSLKDLQGAFDVIVSGADPEVRRGKPAPDIFLRAAKLLEVEPSECLVVEDSQRGIEAAGRAGMKSLAFLSAPVPIDASKADLTLESYGDFFNVTNL